MRPLGYLCFIAVWAGLVCGTCWAQGTTPKPAAPPPLTRAQVETLFAAGVNRLDILTEASNRLMDFEVTQDVLTEWEKLGLDRVLLNSLPLCGGQTLNQFVAANEAIKAKKYDQAATLLSEILQPTRSPRCTEALLTRARCFKILKQYDRSQTDYVKFLAYDPNNVDVNLELGNVLEAAGLMPEAEKLFLQILQAFPAKLSTIHGRLAGLRVHNGQFSMAIQDLLTALLADPSDPELLVRLALLHAFQPGAASQGDPAAREFARAAILLTPDGSQPQEADSKLDDVSKARIAYRIAVWKNRRVWSLQAEALQAALDGQFPAAKELQQRAITSAKSLGDEAVSEERLAKMEEIAKAYEEGKRFQYPTPKSGVSLISTLDSKGAAQLLARRLVRVSGGKFQMGSTRGAPDEKPVHEVTVRNFRISSHEITNAEWAAVMRLPLAGEPNDAHEMVSWDDCQEFIRRLNSEIPSELAVFRLPTEAEWEFAARSGTTTDFSFGDDPKLLAEYGWHDRNWKGRANPVAQLKSNPAGLYDLYGNVAEWCHDSYTPYRGAGTAAGQSNSENSLRVVRGGHRRQPAELCRSAARGFASARDRLKGIGFRLAADWNGETEPQVVKVAGPHPKGLLSIIEQANNTSSGNLHPVARRSVEMFVQLILGSVMLDLQNEEAALAAFEKAQNLATPPTGKSERDCLAPNPWVFAICSRCWIYATSSDAAIRNPQRAEAMAIDANMSTQNNNWLPYVARAAANAALKNWEAARKWEETGLEQSKNPVALVSSRIADACKKRKALYDDNKLGTDRSFPFPVDEFLFPHR